MTRPSRRQLVSIAVLLFFGGLGGIYTYMNPPSPYLENTQMQMSEATILEINQRRTKCDEAIVRQSRSDCGATYEITGCGKTHTYDARREYFAKEFRDDVSCDDTLRVETRTLEYGCTYDISGCGSSRFYSSFKGAEKQERTGPTVLERIGRYFRSDSTIEDSSSEVTTCEF